MKGRLNQRRGRSPKRPAQTAKTSPGRTSRILKRAILDIILGCGQYVLDWIIIVCLDPLVGHFAWYSYWILWLVNGNWLSCNYTAIVAFAKHIDLHAREINTIVKQKNPVQNAVTCWKSRTGKRPLMICVSWDPTSRYAVHWLCYNNKVFTHSACFVREATRTGKQMGFATRQDSVGEAASYYFDLIAGDSSCAFNGHEHRVFANAIFEILDKIPEMHQAVDMEKVKKEIYVRALHRTYITKKLPINLSYSSKDTWN